MQDFITKPGFKYKFYPYACKSCRGNCCRGSAGYVWLTENEVQLIADYLSVEIEKFQDDYLRGSYRGYYIKEIKVNGEYYCIFFDQDKRNCSLYELRPEQCKSFPFWDYYKDRVDSIVEDCPGVGYL